MEYHSSTLEGDELDSENFQFHLFLCFLISVTSPLRCFLKLSRLESLRTAPGLSMFLTPPVPAEDVGMAAAAAAGGLATTFFDNLPGMLSLVLKS